MIGDGNAMGVTGQILQDMVCPAKGWFGIHDPILLKQGSEKSPEVHFIRQRQTFTKEAELPGFEGSAQSIAELAAEHSAQHLHGEEEVGAARNPAATIHRQPASRHDTVNMGMLVNTLTIP